MSAFLFLMALLTVSFYGMSEPLHQKYNGQKGGDTTSIQVTGKIQIGSSGFAPVPAFSFNSPMVQAFLTLKKKGFRYEADFSLGLNGSPWMINNSFRLDVVERNNMSISAAINPSLFFQTVSADSVVNVIHVQRNFSIDFTIAYRISQKWVLDFVYLRNTGYDPGALSGNFFDITSSFSPLPLSKQYFVHLKQELFYFDFGPLSGLFTSTHARISHHRIPLSIFLQGVLPIWANFSGNHFKWNTGMMYSF